MSAVTAEQAHRIIRAALLDRADKCRKLAAGRTMSGPANANSRAALRMEAQYCMALEKRLENISVVVLANLLGTAIGSTATERARAGA